MRRAPATVEKLDVSAFYNEYHGHTVPHLQTLFDSLKALIGIGNTGTRTHADAAATAAAGTGRKHSFVWLLGDSSNDNKYWLQSRERACNGYEHVLTPPKSVPDVCHQLNRRFAELGPDAEGRTYTCINAAVEESTVGARAGGATLLPQDAFVRDNMGPDDILLISLGGNDIALKPTVGTIAAMGWLTRVSRAGNVQDGSAWGLGHFHDLLHTQYQQYVAAVCAKVKPRLVVPCMIYYVDECATSQSWANATLGAIGYNSNPGHVQRIIDRIFYECFVADPLQVPGVGCIFPVELSKAMNGKDPADYVARVEPSAQGGAKMAALLGDVVYRQMVAATAMPPPRPPTRLEEDDAASCCAKKSRS